MHYSWGISGARKLGEGQGCPNSKGGQACPKVREDKGAQTVSVTGASVPELGGWLWGGRQGCPNSDRGQAQPKVSWDKGAQTVRADKGP